MCRNAIFVLATAAEFGPGPIKIAIGAHAQAPYYDCSAEFFGALQRILDGYFQGRVIVETPLIRFNKADIVGYARVHRVPLAQTFSCTRGSSAPCGKCPSCLDRAALGVRP